MLERPDPPIVPRVYRPRGDTPVARKSLISSELRAADASRVAAVAENSIFFGQLRNFGSLSDGKSTLRVRQGKFANMGCVIPVTLPSVSNCKTSNVCCSSLRIFWSYFPRTMLSCFEVGDSLDVALWQRAFFHGVQAAS